MGLLTGRHCSTRYAERPGRDDVRVPGPDDAGWKYRRIQTNSVLTESTFKSALGSLGTAAISRDGHEAEQYFRFQFRHKV